MRCLATAVLTLLLAVTVTGESPAAARDPAFRVIVHNDVRGTQISRTLVSSIFLREALRWGDGLRIQPVDQSLRSPVRAEFSEAVLEKSIDGVQLLWTRKLAKGVIPPVVKSSDEEVIAYIARTEGAIGYVSPTVPLPPTVKALDIIEQNETRVALSLQGKPGRAVGRVLTQERPFHDERFLEVAAAREPGLFHRGQHQFLAGLRSGEILGPRWAGVR